MLRVTADVNGRQIGQVAAVNLTESQSGRNTYAVFDVSSVNAGESVVESGEKLFEVEHQYEDGAAKLIELMMAELEQLP